MGTRHVYVRSRFPEPQFEILTAWTAGELITFPYFISNHSKLAQSTTVAGVPTRRHILELGDGSVA